VYTFDNNWQTELEMCQKIIEILFIHHTFYIKNINTVLLATADKLCLNYFKIILSLHFVHDVCQKLKRTLTARFQQC